MKKKYVHYSITILLLCCYINKGYNQVYDSTVRWKVIDSAIKFPSNFNVWLKNNISNTFQGYGPPATNNRNFGEIVGSDQIKYFIDFNKDGRKIGRAHV